MSHSPMTAPPKDPIQPPSIASSAPESRQLHLITAAAQANEARVREILDEIPLWTTQHDRDALRQALQKAAARGHLPILRLLLDSGADVEVRRNTDVPALYKAAEAGHLVIVTELLARGANPNVAVPSRLNQTALFVACFRGHNHVVAALLDGGADVRSVDKLGRTPLLYLASEKSPGANLASERSPGGSVVSEKKPGRNPAPEKKPGRNLASEKKPDGNLAPEKKQGGNTASEKKPGGSSEKKLGGNLASERNPGWSMDTLRLLLGRGRADLEARDRVGRTALMWAANNGNLALVEALLDGSLGKIANISATNPRGLTALHLAATANHKAVVSLLLLHNARTDAVGDGGWTALHNAAQGGHDAIVRLLLNAQADVNAELTTGMTPLHWAAFRGHATTVRLLLEHDKIKLETKDALDRTPMLCAAEGGHHEVARILSPMHAAHRLSPAARDACESLRATVVDFGRFSDGSFSQVFKPTVFDVLYGWDRDTEKPKVDTQTNNIKYRPNLRWIHLPANNIAWVETLLSKWFIEGGHRDIETFKALEKCFDQEHRGPLAHAHFMRTFCHRITPLLPQTGEEKPPSPTSHEDATNTSTALNAASTSGAATAVDAANSVANPPKADHEASTSNDPAAVQGERTKRKGKAEANALKAKGGNGPPGNPPGTKQMKAAGRSGGLASPAGDASNIPSRDSKVVLFMPYLHYETDERRKSMSRTIKRVREGWNPPEDSLPDVKLIKGYLQNKPPLHPRRTLDQFFYHGIDTSLRDTDQVVSRYCERHKIEKKVFMVDQLWLWILGKDLLVTCFPQRWNQPGRDPLNVVDAIIEEANSIMSVYDLAMVVTNRCSVMFDRHRLADQSLQFLDMFESSIGLVTNTESELFSRFNKASELSAEWLESHRHTGRRMHAARPGTSSKSTSSPSLETAGRDGAGALHVTAPVFPDALLDIGTETSLLAEIKDIRDELNILASVLISQKAALDELEYHLIDELQPDGDASSRQAPHSNSGVTSIVPNTDGGSGKSGGGGGAVTPVGMRVVQKIRKRVREQRRLLDVHKQDIKRMDDQAQGIYINLTHLLDLKQKHSNALEARFARDQAMIAARQGQTILTFTIVTILFLPMSFIAAFFSIQITDWERDLTVRYVSKYLFGIGLGISIPLILMAFTVNDIVDAARHVSATFAGHTRWWAALNPRQRDRPAGGDGAAAAPAAVPAAAAAGTHELADSDTDSLTGLTRMGTDFGTKGLGGGGGIVGAVPYMAADGGRGMMLLPRSAAAEHPPRPDELRRLASTMGRGGGGEPTLAGAAGGHHAWVSRLDPPPDLEKGGASSYVRPE